MPTFPPEFDFDAMQRGGPTSLYAIGKVAGVPHLLAWRGAERVPLDFAAQVTAGADEWAPKARLLGVSAGADSAWTWGMRGYLARFDGTKLVPVTAPCPRITRAFETSAGTAVVVCANEDTVSVEGMEEPWEAFHSNVFVRAPGAASFVALPAPVVSQARYAAPLRSVWIRSYLRDVVVEEGRDVVEAHEDPVLHWRDVVDTADAGTWAIATQGVKTLLFHSVSAPRDGVASIEHDAAVAEDALPPAKATADCDTVFIALGDPSDDANARAQKLVAHSLASAIVARVQERAVLGIGLLTSAGEPAFRVATAVAAETKKSGFTPQLWCRRALVERAL